MASYYTKILCPLCGNIPEFSHQNGTSVCRCTMSKCKHHYPWKTKDQWDDILENKDGYKNKEHL